MFPFRLALRTIRLIRSRTFTGSKLKVLFSYTSTYYSLILSSFILIPDTNNHLPTTKNESTRSLLLLPFARNPFMKFRLGLPVRFWTYLWTVHSSLPLPTPCYQLLPSTNLFSRSLPLPPSRDTRWWDVHGRVSCWSWTYLWTVHSSSYLNSFYIHSVTNYPLPSTNLFTRSLPLPPLGRYSLIRCGLSRRPLFLNVSMNG